MACKLALMPMHDYMHFKCSCLATLRRISSTQWSSSWQNSRRSSRFSLQCQKNINRSMQRCTRCSHTIISLLSAFLSSFKMPISLVTSLSSSRATRRRRPQRNHVQPRTTFHMNANIITSCNTAMDTAFNSMIAWLSQLQLSPQWPQLPWSPQLPQSPWLPWSQSEQVHATTLAVAATETASLTTSAKTASMMTRSRRTIMPCTMMPTPRAHSAPPLELLCLSWLSLLKALALLKVLQFFKVNGKSPHHTTSSPCQTKQAHSYSKSVDVTH